jgi:hypothetical protein
MHAKLAGVCSIISSSDGWILMNVYLYTKIIVKMNRDIIDLIEGEVLLARWLTGSIISLFCRWKHCYSFHNKRRDTTWSPRPYKVLSSRSKI